MASGFSKFMAEKRLPRGSKSRITHTYTAPPYGSFYISDFEYARFISLYTEAYKKGEILHVTERVKKVSPLCIDIDLKSRSNVRQYETCSIKSLIEIINRLARENIHITDESLVSYVFEKPSPCKTKDGKYKDGFHVIYPGLCIKSNARLFLIKKARDVASLTNIFGIDYSYDTVFDTNIVTGSWMLLGSTKNADATPKYSLTHVFDESIKEINREGLNRPSIFCTRHNKTSMGVKEDSVLWSEIEAIKDLNTKEFDIIDEGKKRLDKLEAQHEYQIDEIRKEHEEELKITPYSDIEKVRLRQEKEVMTLEKRHNREKEQRKKEVTHLENNISLARELVKILDSSRAEDYTMWVRVCWCLKNISLHLFTDWVNFSKRCEEKFDSNECQRVWNNAQIRDVTIGTLKFWAKSDNPDKYNEIAKKFNKETSRTQDPITHNSIAIMLYNEYEGLIVHCEDTWYEYLGNKWSESKKIPTLSRYMSETLVEKHLDLGEVEYSNYKLKLGNRTFKENVIRESEIYFRDETLASKLNSNETIIGFDNGVYELDTGIFRKTEPGDYVSISVGYDYKEFTMKSPEVLEVCDYFSQLQTNKEIREYLLTIFSSLLDGANKDQKFFFFTGYSGSNGKSTCLEFVKSTLGDYAAVADSSLLTRKEVNSGQPKPHLANKRYTRFLKIDEPEGGDKIHIGVMKKLTGGDTITARHLYCGPIEFKPQFKIIVACNKLPQVPSSDGGTWRRIEVVPWDSRFIPKDKLKGKLKRNEFLIDPLITDKLKKWRQPFIWLLINEYYPLYRKMNRLPKTPSIISKKVEKYRNCYDFINNFFSVSTKLDANSIVEIDDIMRRLRQYCDDKSILANRKDIPTKTDIISHLESMSSVEELDKFGGRVKGIRILGRNEVTYNNNDISD